MEVTSQAIYKSQNMFNPAGLFSEEIFGQTDAERSYRCGYIKLPIYIFNPHVAKTIILRSGGIIKKMAYAEVKCDLKEDGTLVENPEGKYTGMKDLFNIWDKIDIRKTLNTRTQENLDILTKSPKRLLFTDKILVLPPGFRKIGTLNGKQVKSELNTMYMHILGLKSVTSHTTSNVYQIYNKFQNASIEIYTYLVSYVGTKNGFFQQKLLSKTTIGTARNVISAPSYKNDDVEVGLFRTGYPLQTIVSIFNPLVKFQMKQFMSPNNILAIHPNKDEVKTSVIQDMYDDREIDNMMRIFMENPGSRFKKLYLDPEHTKPIIFEAFDINKNEKISRPLTLTDVIYLCCKIAVVDADRMVYTVRYPIGQHFGAFFTKVALMSTIDTMKIQFMGETFKCYPKIDPELPHSKVSTLFVDVVNMVNSRLKPIGGDYDGDTIKSTGIWSDEANAKAEELMYSKAYNIKPDFNTPFIIEVECLGGLYGLTKENSKAKNTPSTSVGLQRILNTPIENINKSFIEELFAAYYDKETKTAKEANFDPTDKITLSKKDYKWVDGTIETTLGRLILNRYMFEKTGLIDQTGYINTVLNEDGLKDLNVLVNNLVVNDKLTTKDLGKYIDARDRLGFFCASFLGAAITPALIRPMENVQKRKKELFAEKEARIKSNNPVDQVMAANEIEKELIGIVKENLKDDFGYDMYASGVNNLPNNYKTINVMRGAVYNNISKKYDVVESSLMESIDKRAITPFANSVVAGAYPSAVGTAEAGYMSKIILALLQSQKIDTNPNSDCGTTSTVPITITKKNKAYLLYRNFNINGKMVMSTIENIGQFVGKTVQMYSPQCCVNKAICAKCGGKAFLNLDVENIGLLSPVFTDKMLNIKLKSKHDLSQNAGIIPDEYIFLDKNNYFTTENGTLKNKTTMKMFIPRLFNEFSGFIRESSFVSCIGIFPVKFYDKNEKELMSTMLTIPVVTSFNVYDDIQEDPEHYIITYEPDSEICTLAIQKSLVNVEYAINQIFLYSHSPQLPYNMMLEMLARCMEINSIDLTGAYIIYELMARVLCRHGNDPFAYVYGKNKDVDQFSYTKLPFKDAVQLSGVLQGMLFQDVSKSMTRGLAMTLNGIKEEETPLEKIIKA